MTTYIKQINNKPIPSLCEAKLIVGNYGIVTPNNSILLPNNSIYTEHDATFSELCKIHSLLMR